MVLGFQDHQKMHFSVPKTHVIHLFILKLTLSKLYLYFGWSCRQKSHFSHTSLWPYSSCKYIAEGNMNLIQGCWSPNRGKNIASLLKEETVKKCYLLHTKITYYIFLRFYLKYKIHFYCFCCFLSIRLLTFRDTS